MLTKSECKLLIFNCIRGLRNITTLFFSILWAPLFLLGLVVLVPLGRLLTAQRRSKALKPRILWGAYALPDTYYKVKADRLYGYDSQLLVWHPSYYNRAWEVPWHIQHFHQFYKILALPRYVGFLWSLARFDIFRYYFDQHQLQDTVFDALELPILKLAGKRIVLFVYGGDVILPGMRAYGGLDFYELVMRDYPGMGTKQWRRRVRRNIALGSKYGDCIISNVPYLDVMPLCQIQRHYVAIDPSEWDGASEESKDSAIRIVHASNHWHNKGTHIIVKVCKQLREEGYPIEFTLLEKTPREEAKEIYMKADIIIEQLLCGNIGMFGIECMALGKPVVAYLREDILEHHPWMTECPIVNANPETLRERLIELINDPGLRARLGEQGRQYVQRYHSLESIGALNDEIYRRLWQGEGSVSAISAVPGLPSDGGGSRLDLIYHP